MKQIIPAKAYRFMLNVAMYSLLLVGVTYYSYTNTPELFGLKNALMPLGGAITLAIILSLVLSIINEVITMFVIKMGERKNR